MKIDDIKKYLIKEKITYKELSIKANISEGTLKNIFSGRVPHPRIDTMQAIETALGIEEMNYINSGNNNVITGNGININSSFKNSNNTNTNTNLSDEEQQLINDFRKLSKDKQTAIKLLLK